MRKNRETERETERKKTGRERIERKEQGKNSEMD